MTKNDIADVLNEIATLMELRGENPFKVRAYQSGARTLGLVEEDLGVLIAEKRLGDIKGLGEALVQKITELHTTGGLKFHEELKASVAPGLIEMLEIPGLGPKKIKALYDKLGVDTIEELRLACGGGEVAKLDGFGEKTQEKILAGIRNRAAYAKRHLWLDAHGVAAPILNGLRLLPQVQRAEFAGSLRRGLETVGDLDFIVAASDAAAVVAWFVSRPGIQETTAQGETKASVRYTSGLQADLRIVPAEQFVFALHHFTGSKDHNVQMRQRALAQGLSLSEWGLGKIEERAQAAEGNSEARKQAAESVGILEEKDLFAALGLEFIPTELREGLGEIEVAAARKLPQLVEAEDLRGAFHNHTTASDGRGTLTQMVTAAQALGWDYLGISDHSKSSYQANGLDEMRLERQIAEIQALNTSGQFRTHVFTGSECDILSDGSLDFSDTTLAQLDYVVASVHNSFSQSEAEMTARIVKALENPYVTMLGHMTGRLLLRRDGYKVDVAKVIDAAIANGVIIELNASPWRLDMDWRHWRRAAERGLMCSINPDAHETDTLAFAVTTGIRAARKGWLTREQVFNTRSLSEVKTYLAGRVGRAARPREVES